MKMVGISASGEVSGLAAVIPGTQEDVRCLSVGVDDGEHVTSSRAARASTYCPRGFGIGPGASSFYPASVAGLL